MVGASTGIARSSHLGDSDWIDSMVLRCTYFHQSGWFFDKARNPSDEAIDMLKKYNIFEGQLAA
eukprot:scaffold60567_cov38-Prasinocladus_malaysianus.AAC.1